MARRGRRPNTERRHLAAGLRSQGLTYEQIGRRLRASPQAVHKLLASAARDERQPVRRCNLSIDQILAWADAHCRRMSRWPTRQSGPILDTPTETWCAVNAALRDGLRGLPGGSSLACLLKEHRRCAARRGRPPTVHLDQLAD